MIEPLIVLNRSEAPENFTTERGVPAVYMRIWLAQCTQRAFLHALCRAHGSCAPPM